MIKNFSARLATAEGTFANYAPVLRKDILTASFMLNGLGLALPMVLLQVYDRIIPNEALETLTLLIIGLSVVLLLDVLLRVTRSYLAGWVGAKYEHETGTRAMERFLKADLTAIEKSAPGTHLDRLGSIDPLRDFYASQAGLTLVDLPFVVLFLGLLAYIGGALIIVPTLLLILLGAIAIILGLRLRHAMEEHTNWDDRRYSFIIEALSGVHTLKGMAMEPLMERRYERLMESYSAANYNMLSLNGLAQGIGSTFSQITMVAVAAIGSILVIQGEMSMGALAASTLLAGRTVQPLLRGLSVWTGFQKIMIAKGKLHHLNDLPQERTTTTQSVQHVRHIELQNVSFRYEEDGEDILKDVNLTLHPGEMIGIKGNNGSGKSTLLWALMGGLTPQKGHIFINNQPPHCFSTESLRTRIAYLPQKPVLFQGTILENMTFFRGNDYIDEALKIAEQLKLDKVLARMPEGFETRIGDASFEELPSGVAQRIAIVRALITKPDVILFDEANSGLDSQADLDLKHLMENLKGQCSIALVSYRPSLLNLADRIFELEGGRLTEVPTSQASV
ncbi:MAG: hypothetical protein CMF31_06960 [Kordiimonas sp.]|nr:hypothetical protein [Kordiimonas sp.]